MTRAFIGAVLLCLTAQTLAAQQALTPSQYFRLRQQADSLARAANPNAAEPLLRQLLQYDDRDPEIWLGLARALQGTQRRAEAIDAYRQVLARGFGYAGDHYFMIARLFAELGNADSTVAYARRALDAKYPNRERFRTESVFEAVRSNAEFKRIAGVVPEGLSRDARWQFDLDWRF